ncbi:hypothetical protein QN277_005322 [Acacia crassicarpa]|uniref:Gnk2-homologous domain-containing protein n=1 Tax=Acacia crassicarpa TaxID=499986 RepID=A0AAE1IW38_9FABA|nr:hypothetical protein QN277_005322 [Acacia crassicarpa]
MIRFMNSSKLFVLLCLVILFNKGQTAYPCSSTTYAQNSTFQTNLNRILSSLSSNVNQSDGVYNTTVVDSNTTVYGSLQCLRDATVQACQKCVSDGINDLLRRCPNNTGAVDWYDNCWLRFSDQNFFSKMEEDPMIILFNTGDATNTTSFMNLLGETLQVVAKEASEGGSKKFATKTVQYNAFQILYTMAQCTSDISETDCYSCLRNSISNLPNCCNGKVGGVTAKPSCYLRYETYAFY